MPRHEPCRANSSLVVLFAALPYVFSRTRMRESSSSITLLSVKLVSCHESVRGLIEPMRMGVPRFCGSRLVFQNRTMERLSCASMATRSAGVLPGTLVHGSVRPLASYSPVPLSLVVESVESDTDMLHANDGMSMGAMSWPVMVSAM